MKRALLLCGILLFGCHGGDSPARPGGQQLGSGRGSTGERDAASVLLNQSKSMVALGGGNLQGTRQGVFERFDGRLIHGIDSIESFQFSADPSSIRTDSDKSAHELLASGWIDPVSSVPIRFQSTELLEIHPGEPEFQVKGILNVQGLVRNVSFRASILSSNGANHILAEIPLTDREGPREPRLKVSLLYPPREGRRVRR